MFAFFLFYLPMGGLQPDSLPPFGCANDYSYYYYSLTLSLQTF